MLKSVLKPRVNIQFCIVKRIVGNSYTGIPSRLPVIRTQAAENLQIGISMFGL
jgi:hypothetical protein